MTLLDMVRSMMSQYDLPLSFWGYALEIVAFTLNRVSSKAVENDIPLLDVVKSSLQKSFLIKDLGEAAYILGIKSIEIGRKG